MKRPDKEEYTYYLNHITPAINTLRYCGDMEKYADHLEQRIKELEKVVIEVIRATRSYKSESGVREVSLHVYGKLLELLDEETLRQLKGEKLKIKEQ